MYKILDFAKLRTASHIIWDIDGTITDENGQLSQEVAAKIISLGLAGVYHSFITGRDAKWLVEKVIKPLQRFFNFARVRDNLIFFGEVGCVMLTIGPDGGVEQTVHPQVKNHPLSTNQGGIRDTLRRLAYDPETLQGYKLGFTLGTNQDVIYDANEQGWVIELGPKTPPCHQYVWSTSKEVFATFETLRDKEGRVRSFDTTPYEETLRRTIMEAGLEDAIDVEVLRTAINIVPKVDSLKLGKSWAAGRALENIRKTKLGEAVVLDAVIDGTIAVGDGRADLDFTVPTFPAEVAERLEHKTLQIIFVGGEQDLPPRGAPDASLRDNIIIRATGHGDLAFHWEESVIHLQAAKGARVVSTVLDFLKQWDYFRPF